MKIDNRYQNAIEKIKTDSENYASLAMKPIYQSQSDELDGLHKMIGKTYIDYSTDGLLKLSTDDKATVMNKFKDYLKNMGKALGATEVKTVTDILMNVFKDTYYKNIYTLESGLTINLKFPILKQSVISTAVNKKYKGDLFSDRIWSNKADMIDQLQKSLVQAMKGDTTIDQIGKDIKDRFGVTAYESTRLVQTETARVHNEASDTMAHDMDIKQVMWMATLESKTCDECADLDGKTWNIDDDHPDVPAHPECRCILLNVPYDGWNPTQRKDSESKDIIDYTTYADWAKAKNISTDDEE